MMSGVTDDLDGYLARRFNQTSRLGEILDPVGTPDAAIDGASCETRPTAAEDLTLLSPDYGPYSFTTHPVVVDCTYPLLPSGITVRDTINGTVDPALVAGKDVVNQAAGYATTYDPRIGNNLGVVAKRPGASADLVVTKTTSTPSVTQGDTAKFTITVENKGPSDATGVVVKDTPTGLKFVSAKATDGTFKAATGTWMIPVLRSGETATLHTTYDVTGTKPSDRRPSSQ